MRLQIDEEFRDACPPLSPGEKSLLKESIIKHGFREPILHWNGTIVDGHNRYEIALELNMTFPHRSMNFRDRHEALCWIIKNQIGRRNLTREQVRYLWGKHFANLTEPNFECPTPPMSIRGAAKAAGLDRSEVKRVIKFAKEVDKMPAPKRQAVLAGKERKNAKKAKEEPVAVAEPPRKTDAEAGRIPLALNEVATSKALPNCMSLIDQIIATVKKAANEDTGAWLATGPLMVALTQARDVISASLFYDKCPECEGKKGGCDDCRRSGWVPKYRYDELCGIAGASSVPGRSRK